MKAKGNQAICKNGREGVGGWGVWRQLPGYAHPLSCVKIVPNGTTESVTS